MGDRRAFVILPPELQQWVDEYETEERRLENANMGRYAQDSGGGDFTPAPAGTHVARCIKLIDIGTHHGEYQGTPNVRNQVIVQWELPNETLDIGGEQKPAIVSKFYTNSLSEKANLRKDLESWRARPFTTEELLKFDLMKILGAPCMISVIHETKDGKTRAKVSTVAAMPKGMQCPPAYAEPHAFWIAEWSDEAFAALPDGFKRLIEQSDEYKARSGEKPKISDGYDAMYRPDTETDDIPF